MNFGLAERFHRLEVIAVDRRRDADQRADPIVLRSGRQRNIRAERKARRPQLCAGVLRGHEIDAGPEIVTFAAPLVPRPALRPTPRKLKRSTAQPTRASALALWRPTFVCIVPPWVGSGCA